MRHSLKDRFQRSLWVGKLKKGRGSAGPAWGTEIYPVSAALTYKGGRGNGVISIFQPLNGVKNTVTRGPRG